MLGNCQWHKCTGLRSDATWETDTCRHTDRSANDDLRGCSQELPEAVSRSVARYGHARPSSVGPWQVFCGGHLQGTLDLGSQGGMLAAEATCLHGPPVRLVHTTVRSNNPARCRTRVCPCGRVLAVEPRICGVPTRGSNCSRLRDRTARCATASLTSGTVSFWSEKVLYDSNALSWQTTAQPMVCTYISQPAHLNV